MYESSKSYSHGVNNFSAANIHKDTLIETLECFGGGADELRLY